MYIFELGQYLKVDAAFEASLKTAKKEDEKVKTFTSSDVAKPAGKAKEKAKG